MLGRTTETGKMRIYPQNVIYQNYKASKRLPVLGSEPLKQSLLPIQENKERDKYQVPPPISKAPSLERYMIQTPNENAYRF
jgi:hypothetical protein